jgi:hypothetical protein
MQTEVMAFSPQSERASAQSRHISNQRFHDLKERLPYEVYSYLVTHRYSRKTVIDMDPPYSSSRAGLPVASHIFVRGNRGTRVYSLPKTHSVTE